MHLSVIDLPYTAQLVSGAAFPIAALNEKLHRHTGDALFPSRNSTGDIAHYFGLSMLILAGIAMRAIGDKAMDAADSWAFSARTSSMTCHGFGIVVRAVHGTTQYHMAIRVAECLDCTGTAQVVNAEERVLLGSGEATVHGGLDRAIVAFLEAHRHGQAAGWLSVNLAFRVAARRWHPSSPRPR